MDSKFSLDICIYITVINVVHIYNYRCLHMSGGCLMFSPDKCAQIAICCMRLHNLCLTRGLPAPEPVSIDQDNALCIQGQNEPQGRGITKREAIVRLFS